MGGRGMLGKHAPGYYRPAGWFGCSENEEELGQWARAALPASPPAAPP